MSVLTGIAAIYRVGKIEMAKEGVEIEVSSTDEDGHPIRGSYRIAAGVVHVTLSDGTSSETELGNTPAPTLAKIILQELDRKRRGDGLILRRRASSVATLQYPRGGGAL
jgi:hypothetical protein